MGLAFSIVIGIPLLILLVMFIFGLYTTRNLGWIAICLTWGGVAYSVLQKINGVLLLRGMEQDTLVIFLTPIIHQVFVLLCVYFVLYRQKSDNLIEGAVYGWAAGISFATVDMTFSILGAQTPDTNNLLAHSFSTTLVYATAAGITGLVITQFYFRHHSNRIVVLLSGLAAAIGHNALYIWLDKSSSNETAPVLYSIGGLTLMSLYIAGQLRRILIQLGIQKSRADGLLDIVIPIGVNLASEKDFQKLLENMLVEAQNFCHADAGTLYLKRNNLLEFAVTRNNTLNMAMGGTSGNKVTMPPIELYDKDGIPNHNNVAAFSARTGEVINIEDAYENKKFDFAGTREFDRQTGYISSSFLIIPLKDSQGKVQGILQLLNALDSDKKTIIPFDANLQQLMTSFSSLASAALEGYIHEQSLRKEIQELKIEIDHAKRNKQVAEITDSSYFKELQQKAQLLREKEKSNSQPVK